MKKLLEKIKRKVKNEINKFKEKRSLLKQLRLVDKSYEYYCTMYNHSEGEKKDFYERMMERCKHTVRQIKEDLEELRKN